MTHATSKTMKNDEMRYIIRDGKNWVVAVRDRIPGRNYNSRHLTLAEAQEARDNAIRGQSNDEAIIRSNAGA